MSEDFNQQVLEFLKRMGIQNTSFMGFIGGLDKYTGNLLRSPENIENFIGILNISETKNRNSNTSAPIAVLLSSVDDNFNCEQTLVLNRSILQNQEKEKLKNLIQFTNSSQGNDEFKSIKLILNFNQKRELYIVPVNVAIKRIANILNSK